jgi:hypothetical protein
VSESRDPAGRKRGAQPGNRNRLRHGLYSREAKARRIGVRALRPLLDEALADLSKFVAIRRGLDASRLPQKSAPY